MNDSDLKTGNHLSPSPKGEDVRDQQMFTHTHTHIHTHRVRASQRNGKTTQAPEREQRGKVSRCLHIHTHTHTELLTDSERKFNKAPL